MIDEKFVHHFNSKGLSLLILKNNQILFSSYENGILPILNAIEEIEIPKLKDSFVMDKTVGKAAALCICYFKADYIYSKIMSKLASNLLERWNIEYKTENFVDMIKSSDGVKPCPFEKEVLDIDDPKQGYLRIRRLVQTMGK